MEHCGIVIALHNATLEGLGNVGFPIRIHLAHMYSKTAFEGASELFPLRGIARENHIARGKCLLSLIDLRSCLSEFLNEVGIDILLVIVFAIEHALAL